MYRNDQTVDGWVAMANPKGLGKAGYRMVSDYRVVNATVEQAAILMPNLGELARLLEGSRAFFTSDLDQKGIKNAIEPE